MGFFAGVTSLDNTFSSCYDIKSITLPDGVKKIGEEAFLHCSSLRTIIIPQSVKSIGKDAFLDCYDLIIHGYNNSKAQSFAKANKIPFKIISEPINNSYNVKFIGNGATSGSMNSQDIKVNKTVKLNANKFKRTGYTFAGWNTKKNGKGKSYKNKAQVNNLGKSGKTVKLYAQWTANKYTIKFNANGGKAKTKMANQAMTYGKNKKLSKNKFSRKGYKFAGWATSKANAKKGIVAYKNRATVKNLTSKNNKTVTLYAVWKKK